MKYNVDNYSLYQCKKRIKLHNYFPIFEFTKTQMKVSLTEKPRLARKITNILGANTKRNKFDKGNNYSIKT